MVCNLTLFVFGSLRPVECLCVCLCMYVYMRKRDIRDSLSLKMVTWWLSKMITNHSWQLHRGDQGLLSHFFYSNKFLKVGLFLKVNFSALQNAATKPKIKLRRWPFEVLIDLKSNFTVFFSWVRAWLIIVFFDHNSVLTKCVLHFEHVSFV